MHVGFHVIVVLGVGVGVCSYGGCMDSYVADATVSKIESFFVYEGCRVIVAQRVWEKEFAGK